MSPTPDLDRLQAYLDGRLADAEVRRLEAELKADPGLCAALVRLAREEAVLAEWARAASYAQEAAPTWRKPAPVPRRPFRLWLPLAASLAAIALVGVLYRPAGPPAPEPLAHLEKVEGDVEVVNPAGDSFAAASGQGLYPGQRLRTGDGSFAIVQYGPSTRLEIGAETVIRLPLDGGQPESVRLEEGQLMGDFVRQPESNPMLVQTPHAEVRASGSRVSFSSAAGGTRVDPEEGTIEVTRTSDGQSIRVPSGSYAVAAPEDDPFVPRPLPAKFNAPRITLDAGSATVQICALSPDGKTLASGTADGIVKLWDLAAGRVRRILRTSDRAVRALSYSADGRLLAAATDERDRPVRIWDPATGREIAVLEGPKLRITTLAFAPEGTTLLTGGVGGRTGGEVRLWEATTGREHPGLSGDGREVQAVAYSPDGTHFATGSVDGQVRLWDAATGVIRHKLAAHTQHVRVLTFSPDGKTLVSGGRDGLVRLWDVTTGAVGRTLRDHAGEVRGLAFSADGRVLATGGADRMVRLYDGDEGGERIAFRADKHYVSWVGFSPDGRTLFTAGWDKTIKLWDLGEDEPAARKRT